MLESLFTKYGTDKGIWGYTPAYERYLADQRHKIRAVLEIGICGHRDIPNNVIGASLFAWQDYFPNAHIVGIDNDGRWMVNEGRIQSRCINAYNDDALRAMLQDIELAYDFICDDAVHDPEPQIQLLINLLPFLKQGGLYAIEDTCPYKLPDNDLQHMIRRFPKGTKTEIVTTAKPERLLLVTRE